MKLTMLTNLQDESLRITTPRHISVYSSTAGCVQNINGYELVHWNGYHIVFNTIIL